MRAHLFLTGLIGLAISTSVACSDDEGDSKTPTSEDGGTNDAVSDADPGCGLNVPAVYESEFYESNVASEMQIRARFTAFIQPMSEAESDLSKTPTAASIRDLFDAGDTESLRFITTPYYAGKIDTFLDAFAASAGKNWAPSEPPPANGGKYGSFIFTERGTDLRQAIEKGMLAATFYNHALSIIGGPLTEAGVDRLIAIYGAHPSFPRNESADTSKGGAAHPDSLIAAYAKRRDPGKSDQPGYYLRMKTAFLTMRAAIPRSDCKKEMDAAIASFKRNWEGALLASAVHDLDGAAKVLSSSGPTPADLSSALHGYGEAVGFIHGFYGLPATDRRITDTEILGLLMMLGAAEDSGITSYRLVTDRATQVPKLGQAVAEIARIEGFSQQDIEAFKIDY